MKRCYLTWLIILPCLLFAQDHPDPGSTSGEAVISFHEHGSALFRNGNAILMRLAAAEDESPRRMRLRVSFGYRLNVKESEMASPEVTLRFSGVRATGTPVYRSFRTEEVLTPDRVMCNLNLIDLPDSNILRQFRLTELDVRQLASGYTTTEIPVVQPGKFAITLSDITFYFSDEALERFGEHISTIHNYYASAALIDSILRAIDGWDPLSLRDLPRKYIRLMEVNRIVKLIRNHGFGERLSLGENDPAQLERKFIRLEKFSLSASMTFGQQVADPAPLAWNGSLEELSREFTLHLVSYIRKSMLLNSERGGIYREYLETWFENHGFAQEGEIFQSLLQKLYPDEEPRNALDKVSRAVCDASYRTALRLIGESDYASAIGLLQFTSSFRDHHPVGHELPDPQPLLIEAVKGIYASYLGIAESCIEQQKWEMADTYLHRAEEYVSEFRGAIPADTLFRRISGKLFNRRLNGCDELLDGKQYRDAYACFQDLAESYPGGMSHYVNEHLASRRQLTARGLFLDERDKVDHFMRTGEPDSALASYERALDWYGFIPASPENRAVRDALDSRMLPVRYRQLAEQGRYLYLSYNHEEAFRVFSRLKEIARILGITVDTAIVSMYLESYKHHMLNEISMATGMIWKDEFDQAREYAREVESVMDLYNLESDPDLREALQRYRQKIDRKVCLNVKEDAEMLAVRAGRNLELKQFDLAVRQLGEARKLMRHHAECGLDASSVEDIIRRYISAAFYQEKLQEARHQVALGNYGESLRLISDNERFYRRTGLEQFGVPFTPAIDFVYESSRTPMFLEAIRFFLQAQDVNSAWNCLLWLNEEGVDSRDVREYQESVGSAMATRDFGLFAGSDPEQRVKLHTGGNRWFTKFAWAYTVRWRQLHEQQSIQNTIRP